MYLIQGINPSDMSNNFGNASHGEVVWFFSIPHHADMEILTFPTKQLATLEKDSTRTLAKMVALTHCFMLLYHKKEGKSIDKRQKPTDVVLQ